MQNEHDADYGINLDLILKTGDRYLIAQEMAVTIKMNGLMTVGMLMQSIETDKLQHMIDFIEETYESADPSDDTCHEELMLVTLMMIYAEGGQISMDPDVAIRAMSQTVMFLMMESLSRKGLVELRHENMSYDDAVSDRIVAKATQAGLDFAKNGGEDD